jgi:hypothetical protein
MAGLVPAIPMIEASCLVDRDRRDKPGDDVHEEFDLIGTWSKSNPRHPSWKTAWISGQFAG